MKRSDRKRRDTAAKQTSNAARRPQGRAMQLDAAQLATVGGAESEDASWTSGAGN